ncbi:MAG: hypothetical protein NTZ95_02355 [Candidatus Omnitrophica bacterium]|nr:hypothetical protein [Candidatus Omnitrophota bacterium]
MAQLENQANKILLEIDSIRKGDVASLVNVDLKGQQPAFKVSEPSYSKPTSKEDAETRIGK